MITSDRLRFVARADARLASVGRETGGTMRSFRQPKWLVVFNKFDDLAAVRGLLPSREDGCQVFIKARNGDVGRIPEEGFEIND